MSAFDLAIHEDRLEEFERWFDETHASKSAKRETRGFTAIHGSYAVLYTVRVSFRSEKAATLVRETWGTKGASPA